MDFIFFKRGVYFPIKSFSAPFQKMTFSPDVLMFYFVFIFSVFLAEMGFENKFVRGEN